MRSLIGSIRGFARTEAVGLPGPAQSNLTLPDHAEFIICNQSIDEVFLTIHGERHLKRTPSSRQKSARIQIDCYTDELQ
jgi:hypothetical protein